MSDSSSKKWIIKVKDLSVRHDKNEVLQKLNFTIQANELVAILGPSGVGKTSLINCLAGLGTNFSGKIEYVNPIIKNNLGFVFQNYALYEEISVYKNIYLSIRNSQTWVRQFLIEKIKSFLVTHKLPPLSEFDKQQTSSVNYLVMKKWPFFKFIFWTPFKNIIKAKKTKLLFQFFQHFYLKKGIDSEIQALAKNLEIDSLLKKQSSKISGGQKQRVAIAKALIKNSEIIFMDEPFSSLDAVIKEKSRDWVKKIKDKYQVTIVLVTHDQNDAILISDKIMFIADHKIQQYDHPTTFFDQPKNKIVAEFIGYPKINFLKEENEIQYFIRPNKLKLIPTNNANEYNVSLIQNLGNAFIISAQSTNNTVKIITPNNELKIGQKVKLDFKLSDLVCFDKNGNNIFYEKNQKK